MIANGSGHWVQLDRPDLVVRAALELVQHARARMLSK
jgi:pimeloyl-ACP methyl ester carboxylesterase